MIDNGSRNFNFEDVHIEGASRIAEAVAKYDVDRFVHVSSYNVDPNSPSRFFQTKVSVSGGKSNCRKVLTVAMQAKGEEIVRSIFPETTLVRPAPMFGWEDKLLNKFAGETQIWASNHLQQRIRPVHVSNRPI